MLVLVRLLDGDPARHEVGAEPIELLGFFARGRFDGIGRFHAEEADLKRLFHRHPLERNGEHGPTRPSQLASDQAPALVA
jgi:hypothetical protein